MSSTRFSPSTLVQREAESSRDDSVPTMARSAEPAMLTLYTTPLSANGRKVQAAGRHLGLDLEIRLVNVYAGEGRTPEYLRVNPTGKIAPWSTATSPCRSRTRSSYTSQRPFPEALLPLPKQRRAPSSSRKTAPSGRRS